MRRTVALAVVLVAALSIPARAATTGPRLGDVCSKAAAGQMRGGLTCVGLGLTEYRWANADVTLPARPPIPLPFLPGSGRFVIGVQVAAGTYRTNNGGTGACFWSTENRAGKTLQVSALTNGPLEVRLNPSTAYLIETGGCMPFEKIR